MRKIENKLNIHFFGLPPNQCYFIPLCCSNVPTANQKCKFRFKRGAGGGGFGGFYGDRSNLALSIIVSHISWKKLIRRSNPFLFKSLLFHTYTHTRKDTFAHISN